MRDITELLEPLKPTDTFFLFEVNSQSSHSSWYHRAHLQSLSQGQLVKGYQSAGGILTDYLKKSPGLEALPDFLVYPIIFNYRHAIELALKHVLLMARIVDAERGLEKSHRIYRLWQDGVRSVYEKLCPSKPIEEMDRLLKELDSFDPESMNEEVCKEKQIGTGQALNIANFADVSEKILSDLTGLVSIVSIQKSIRDHNQDNS